MSIKPKNAQTPNIVLPQEVEELTRRELIENGVSLAAFASVASLLGQSSKAIAGQYPPQKRLIWINMSGGWDILEVTDPKSSSTSGIDMVYGWGEAHELAGGDGTRIGRWCSQIASLGKDVLVVRGLAMGTTAHQAGSLYMDTAILSNAGRVNAASIPSIVASESQATIPLIQLSGGSEPLIDRGLLGSVSAVRASNLDLYRSMYATEKEDVERRKAILNYIKTSLTDYKSKVNSHDRFTDLESAEAKLRVQFDGSVGSKLILSDAEKADFSRCTSDGRANATSDAFALATKLILNDLVSSVNLGVGGFDTHAAQSARMEPILSMTDKLVKTMVDKLKAANQLDSTLIVLYSDFGRTPKVNSSNGRDHWPVGGALMIGGGISGGRSVGATNDNLLAESIDLTSGNISSSGTQLNPTHLAGSVLSLVLGSGYLTYRPYMTALELLTRRKT